MAHIVLNADQLRIVEQATTPVDLRDETGRVVAKIPAPSEEQIIKRIKRDRAADLPRYPAEQVEARLRRLDEIRREEGIDEAKLRDLLRRMRAGEVI
jgi:hypothetical protein